jgi:hypothetical protein
VSLSYETPLATSLFLLHRCLAARITRSAIDTLAVVLIYAIYLCSVVSNV